MSDFDRQPVHTVYGGAHLFRAGTAPRLGELARAALDTWAADEGVLARAVGLDPAVAGVVEARVRDKLAREPVEDFRVDFEDGGSRQYVVIAVGGHSSAGTRLGDYLMAFALER